VYDSLGREHTVSITFEKVAGANEWIWTAATEGGEQILSGGSGRVGFGTDGTVSSFTYDDGAGALTFRPQPDGDEGAELVVLTLDYGDIGGLNGLTQFEGTSSLYATADGFQAGQLVDFDIDQYGTITGYFSNDTLRTIAQIGLVQFSNPAGLTRESDNTYQESGNSGEPVEIFAGDANSTAIISGALEASNVDLAAEFTRLVVAQRAFQANSRVVSAGDQIMQELVNLIR
jgi:flagellar hook protein FlgE